MSEYKLIKTRGEGVNFSEINIIINIKHYILRIGKLFISIVSNKLFVYLFIINHVSYSHVGAVTAHSNTAVH